MTKFIITWDGGRGETSMEVIADTLEEAENEAYHAWLDAVNDYGFYRAEPYTKERAEELGVE